MKRIISILLSVVVVALFACNDKSALLQNSDDGTTQLASDNDGQFILKTQTGDGPVVEKILTPVKWDGKSELKKGVLYSWNSIDEALAAYENTNPEKYLKLMKISGQLNSQQNGKKEKSNVTGLAFSPSVYANVYSSGGYSITGECSITQPAASCSTNHYLCLQTPPQNPFLEYDQDFGPGSPHYSSLARTYRCPHTPIGAIADLTVVCESPGSWVAIDDDYCN